MIVRVAHTYDYRIPHSDALIRTSNIFHPSPAFLCQQPRQFKGCHPRSRPLTIDIVRDVLTIRPWFGVLDLQQLLHLSSRLRLFETLVQFQVQGLILSLHQLPPTCASDIVPSTLLLDSYWPLYVAQTVLRPQPLSVHPRLSVSS